MHKLLFITLLLSFYSTFLNAQGHYDKCYFGTAGVDFGDGYPSVLLNSQMIAVETAVSVCSENGTLLFTVMEEIVHWLLPVMVPYGMPIIKSWKMDFWEKLVVV